VSEAVILAMHFGGVEVAFLWYNLIAPAIVVARDRDPGRDAACPCTPPTRS
jgi:hypothetical protein